jgi:hypothetical protein
MIRMTLGIVLVFIKALKPQNSATTAWTEQAGIFALEGVESTPLTL